MFPSHSRRQYQHITSKKCCTAQLRLGSSRLQDCTVLSITNIPGVFLDVCGGQAAKAAELARPQQLLAGRSTQCAVFLLL